MVLRRISCTDRHRGTVTHEVHKNVNAAPGVLVRYPALPYNIEHRGVCFERRKTTHLPRRFWSVGDSDLLWHRLIVRVVLRCMASLGNCFLGCDSETVREDQYRQQGMKRAHAHQFTHKAIGGQLSEHASARTRDNECNGDLTPNCRP
jgi:hypothetical protein